MVYSLLQPRSARASGAKITIRTSPRTQANEGSIECAVSWSMFVTKLHIFLFSMVLWTKHNTCVGWSWSLCHSTRVHIIFFRRWESTGEFYHYTTTNRCITTYPLRLWSVSCTFCISGSTNHRDNELNIKILKRYLFTHLFLSIAVLRNSVACIISSRFMVKILFVPDNCWMGRLSTGEVAV